MLETITAVACVFAVGVGACVAFFVGINIGLLLYGHLSAKFQRSAEDAFGKAYADAYRDFLSGFNEKNRRKKEVEDHPAELLNKDEQMKSFEDAVAVMYPADKELQKKMIENRRAEMTR